MEHFDVIIIGAGIAGASAGAWLAEDANVLMLEAEQQPGYHTTGRSAATFIENYGAPSVRKLNRASAPFLTAPPDDFADGPVVGRRGLLYLATASELGALDDELAGAKGMQRLDANGCATLVPVLRGGPAVAGGFEANALDIDVDRLHQSYLRAFRKAGGQLRCGARVNAVSRSAGMWRVAWENTTAAAPSLVNAAGAWGDHIARLAGVKPLGLTPLRRSVAIVEPAMDDVVAADWPLLAGVAGNWYAKPEGRWLLVSPADETPSEPCDAWPEDIDLATGVDRMQQITGIEVRRMVRSWAGLRTFAPDRQLVNGFDPDVSGFYWLVGQGGYGIQTSPAMGRVCAAQVLAEDASSASAMAAADIDALSPARLRG
ncbi:MAG: FAD-dependent oxidoreductase [Pseudomonadota bacterium]